MSYYEGRDCDAAQEAAWGQDTTPTCEQYAYEKALQDLADAKDQSVLIDALVQSDEFHLMLQDAARMVPGVYWNKLQPDPASIGTRLIAMVGRFSHAEAKRASEAV